MELLIPLWTASTLTLIVAGNSEEMVKEPAYKVDPIVGVEPSVV
jgi:hypothetical protein